MMLALITSALLALCHIALSLAQAETEPVYGIEITMSGAHAAVSLPNGSLVPAASVQGDSEYQDLMAEWFGLCTSVHVDHTNTSMLKERVEAAFPHPTAASKIEVGQSRQRHWSGKKLSWSLWIMWKLGRWAPDVRELYALDDYPNDRATEILAHTLRNLHDAALLDLKSAGQMEEHPMPFADFALPSWFFTKVPELHGDAELHEGGLIALSGHLAALTSRISTALHRAGFRRSATASSDDIMRMHAEGRGTLHIGGSGMAPVHAEQEPSTLRCDHDSFEASSECVMESSAPRCDTCAARAVLEWTGAGQTEYMSAWYTLYKVGSQDLAFSCWHTWKIPTQQKHSPYARPVFFNDLVAFLTQAWKDTSGVPVIATLGVAFRGNRWSAAARDALQQSLREQNVSHMVRGSLVSEYAVASEMATRARMILTGYLACKVGSDLFNLEEGALNGDGPADRAREL